MKVVQVASGMATGMGGPPRVIAGITNALVQGGVSTRLLAPDATGPGDSTVPIACPADYFTRSRPHFWYTAPGLPQGLAEHAGDADIVHLHEVWSHPQFAAACFASRRGIPHVLTPHGELGRRHMRHKGPMHHLKKRGYLRTMGRKVLHGAACVHVLSAAEEEGLRAVGYRGPVTIIPNGVHLDEFADLPPRESADERWPQLAGRRVVLFLSRLSPEKGLSRLLPAWAEIAHRDALADAVLVLAGPNDRGYGDIVARLIQQHDLQDRVVCTGMVQGNDRLRLLSRADVYTLPSFSEGFSMSLLEALACGNRAVYTPQCNFPEAEQAGAGLCVVPEVTDLRDALVECLEMDATRQATMEDAARQLVARHYTWNSVAAQLQRVYQCLRNGIAIPRTPTAWSSTPQQRAA